MFIESLKLAIGILANWEIYPAALLYITIAFLPVAVFNYILSRTGRSAGLTMAARFIVAPVAQLLATFIFISSISGILLGTFDSVLWDFSWKFIENLPYETIKLFGIMILGMIIAAAVPILGQTQIFGAFVAGVPVLIYSRPIVTPYFDYLASENAHILPGFGMMLGLFSVGAIVATLALFLVGVLGSFLSFLSKENSQLLLFPIVSVLGFFPVFIYGGWMRIQMFH